MKLKGSLITKGYIETIHFADENEDFYLNSFSTSPENIKDVEHFILYFIENQNIYDAITLLSATSK